MKARVSVPCMICGVPREVSKANLYVHRKRPCLPCAMRLRDEKRVISNPAPVRTRAKAGEQSARPRPLKTSMSEGVSTASKVYEPFPVELCGEPRSDGGYCKRTYPCVRHPEDGAA